MTASSSYIGTVDNFWSRDDVRVHTVGVRPRQLKSSLRNLFEGKPTRTAGAKRRGAEAARQPVSAGDLLGVRRPSRLGVMARIRTPRRARHGTPHPHGSLTPSCANCVSVVNKADFWFVRVIRFGSNVRDGLRQTCLL